jgi:uncharacterized membrane protein
MFVQITILLLCAGGLYASAFMYRKALRAARGELSEPSIVETPRARALGGVPNAAFGIAYYAGLALLVPALGVPAAWWTACAAAAAAGAFSAYLAYSLIFVTRAPCPYCWASHIANWAILALLVTHQPR